MAASDLTEKLLFEFRQSPGKFAVLGIGMVVAVVIWGPRLVAGLGDQPSPTPAATGGGEPQLMEASDSMLDRRDPNMIRSEFIAISERARKLTEFARPTRPEGVGRDPFDAKSFEVAQVAIQPEPAPIQDPAQSQEQGQATAVHLDAVFHFKSGPRAVINGTVVQVGDEVEGLMVVEIGARSVLLRGAYSEYRASIEDEEEK